MPRPKSEYEKVDDNHALDKVTGEIIPLEAGYSYPKDGEWQGTFLANLACTGNVQEASRAAGQHPANAYWYRKQNPDFAAEWDVAIESAVAVLEAEAFRRALEYSDQLLMFLLKSRKPSVYGNKAEITHREPIKVEQFDFDQSVAALIGDNTED
jgi:hypothetical protein